MVGPSLQCTMKQWPDMGANITDIFLALAGSNASMPQQTSSSRGPSGLMLIPTTSDCPRKAPITTGMLTRKLLHGGHTSLATGLTSRLQKDVFEIHGFHASRV